MTAPKAPDAVPSVCQMCHPSAPLRIGPRLIQLLLCPGHTAGLPMLGMTDEQCVAYLTQREIDYPWSGPGNPALTALMPDQMYWVTAPADLLAHLPDVA